MAIQTIHDTGDDYKITPKYDGALYAAGIADCICKGVGDEFTMSYSANSLYVSFAAGSEAIIGGSFFKITSLENVELQANTTVYLCAHINTSRSPGATGYFDLKLSADVLDTGNINGTDTDRDMLLYIITTGATGVQSVQDKRVIRGDGLSVSGYSMTVISESDYNNLSSTDPNTLYFIYD